MILQTLLGDILKYNVYFDNFLSLIYLSELQLNKANISVTEAVFYTCICPVQMILFLPKFMINVMILNLKLSISHIKMIIFLWKLYLSTHSI